MDISFCIYYGVGHKNSQGNEKKREKKTHSSMGEVYE